eukprot:m51a1_g3983 hypothetical protein (574) ;mRNA; r:461533-464508
MMLSDVLYFLVIFVVAIIAFALAAVRLAVADASGGGGGDDSSTSSSSSESFQKHSGNVVMQLVWRVVGGQPDVSMDGIPQVRSHQGLRSPSNPGGNNKVRMVLSQVLFLLFAVIVGVILMNLLIAIMNSSYSTVEKSAEEQYRVRPASTDLVTYETTHRAHAAFLSGLAGKTLYVDVGAADDTSPAHSGGCYLSSAPPGSVSQSHVALAPLQAQRTYRTVYDSRQITVLCDARPLGAATWPDRVPYISAWVNVSFRDDGNSADCTSPDADCTDGVDVRLTASAWASYRLRGGAGDGAWKADAIPLPSSPLQPLRADANGLITLRIVNRGQAVHPAGLPIDMVLITFVTEDMFRKQLDRDRASRGLIRVGWSGSEQDTGVTPSRPTPTSPFVLFGGRSYLEKVYSNSTPQARDRFAGSGLVLEVEEVAGEVEPVSVCLYAFDDVVSVSASGSISTPGVATVTVREVVEQDRLWVYARKHYYGPQPWVLAPLPDIGGSVSRHGLEFRKIRPGSLRILDTAGALQYKMVRVLNSENWKVLMQYRVLFAAHGFDIEFSATDDITDTQNTRIANHLNQ